MLNFVTTLKSEIKRKQSHLCVGLDSDYKKLPNIVKSSSIVKSIFYFNKAIVESTADLVVAYKPNLAFYYAYGLDGFRAIKKTNKFIKKYYPEIKIIAECKRTEIGWVADLAKQELFQELNFDAINIMPWYGYDSIKPYYQEKEKALFVICHDTNPSAVDLQHLKLNNNQYLYEYLAALISRRYNRSGNILIEAALTYPGALKKIVKQTTNKDFFLIVGLGSQGGTIANLQIFKKNPNFIVSASRSVIFASTKNNFAEKARKQVQQYNMEIAQVFNY